MRTDLDDPEKLIRERRWMLPALTFVFLVNVGGLLYQLTRKAREVGPQDLIQLLGCFITGGLVLGVIATGGYLLAPRRTRQVLHDEGSRHAARRAFAWAYFPVFGSGFVMTILAAPLGLGLSQSMLILSGVSVVAPMILFLLFERGPAAE